MEGSGDDEDEEILSEFTANALKEFCKERAAKEALLNNPNYLIDDYVEENWELSQFWYDEKTAATLATVVTRVAGKNGRIACVSSPTVFRQMWKTKANIKGSFLFEYDERFRDLFPGHFQHYNYNSPYDIPENLKLSFDVVIIDPPYLSRECLEKVFETVKLLAKDKIILCTGAIMEKDVHELIGLQVCDFKPTHAKKLGNEFRCFANFDVDAYIDNKANS